MNRKILVLAFAVIILLSAGVYLWLQKMTIPTQTETPPSIPPPISTTTPVVEIKNPDITNTKRDFGGLNDGTTIAFAWSPATNGVFEYVLFRSEFLNGPFMEIGRLPANRSPNAVDTTPDVRVKDLCYKLEARDKSGNILREYEQICIPKYRE